MTVISAVVYDGNVAVVPESCDVMTILYVTAVPIGALYTLCCSILVGVCMLVRLLPRLVDPAYTFMLDVYLDVLRIMFALMRTFPVLDVCDSDTMSLEDVVVMSDDDDVDVVEHARCIGAMRGIQDTPRGDFR